MLRQHVAKRWIEFGNTANDLANSGDVEADQGVD
jgi:hypothetical protein